MKFEDTIKKISGFVAGLLKLFVFRTGAKSSQFIAIKQQNLLFTQFPHGHDFVFKSGNAVFSSLVSFISVSYKIYHNANLSHFLSRINGINLL